MDLDALDVPWRYDVPGSPYPHIYGPIARAAILRGPRASSDAPTGGSVGLLPRRPEPVAASAGRLARPTTENDSGIRPRSSARTSRVAAPPVDRVLGDRLEAQVGAEQRGDDLAERPGPGELPALVVVGDRQPVDVFGRPALRRLGAAEVVVVGRDPVAVGVDVEQPLDRMALEQDEPAARGEEPGDDGGPRVEVAAAR